MEHVVEKNPLGTERIRKLLPGFVIPCAIAMLVNALYNIVDQIFIGQGVGPLGNGATTVAFPLTTISLALALMMGQGGASKQNLELGAGNRERSEQAVGNMLVLLAAAGLLLLVVGLFFLEPLLRFFGATPDNLPYAIEYTRIILWGLPFVVVATGFNNCIRADGSPRYAMGSMLTGAIINTVLDPLFILGFKWGLAGAAYATIIGQIVVCLLSLRYIPRFRHIRLDKSKFKVELPLCRQIVSLGVASFGNQISMAVVQIVLNNLMGYYGALSVYGKDIPLACVGIVIKVNMVFFSLIIGVAQGSQPLISYNYGAKKYDRVKETYKTAVFMASMVAVCSFLLFQLLPRQIIALFGEGSAEYYEFAVKCFHILLFATFVNGIQPVTTIFFTSIGRGLKGTFIALTRQILLLLPLLLLFSRLWGIEGILYAMPVADFTAFLIAILFVLREFRNMNRLAATQTA